MGEKNKNGCFFFGVRGPFLLIEFCIFAFFFVFFRIEFATLLPKLLFVFLMLGFSYLILELLPP